MKAIGFKKHGGLEVLEELEVETPKIGNDEVLVRSIFTSVNRLDILVREGIHGLELPMPHIPGADIVGKVEKVGSEVKNLSEGSLVMANTAYGCGKCAKCSSGEEVLCSSWKCIGLHVNGSYGELVQLPASVIIEAPTTFSPKELGALPLDLSVTWRALNTLAKAKPDETVLIRGASGNAGIFAVLLSKAMGLKVIAETRSSDKAEKLKKLGADLAIVSDDSEKTKSEVMNYTDDIGADIVVETLGSSLNDSIGLAAHAGRIVVFGSIKGIESNVKIRPLYLKSVSIFGTHNANIKEFNEAIEFARRKNIRPIIAQTLPIEEAREAQRLLESSEIFGKIMLEHWS